MNLLRENLSRHLNILCNEIGPRPYFGSNIKKASGYIKSVLASYSCLVSEEEVNLPFMKIEESSLRVVSPLTEDVPCLPWAGFLPYFPSVQRGEGDNIELTAFSPEKNPSVYTKKAVLMEMNYETATGWDIIGIEKYSPSVIIMIDQKAADFKHLKYGTSNLLADILVMPLMKTNVPKMLISRKDGHFLSELLSKEKKVLIDYRCFTCEDISKTVNIEASFSAFSDMLLWVHYDSAWECPSCTGANDNASSVSVALEFIRLLRGTEHGNRVKVVFAGSEECSAFSGLSYFVNTEDFMSDFQSRMAIMITAMRTHERVLPFVKPLVKSRYFQSLMNFSRMKNIRYCLELECLGYGKAFYLLTPARSLFAKHYRKISSDISRPVVIMPQNLGLETHWLSLYKKCSSGVLAGQQDNYPFHTPEDNLSMVDIDMMKEAICLIRELLR
ncbi:MAG: M28 family peptidase [Candidatus Eremiobacterota bacterium]